MDIEDTRPIFNIAVANILNNLNLTSNGLPPLIQTGSDLKNNIINRAFSPNNVIKELNLPNLLLNDYRLQISDAYTASTGQTLTDSEFNALIVATNATVFVNSASGANKDQQTKYFNAMATTPLTEY